MSILERHEHGLAALTRIAERELHGRRFDQAVAWAEAAADYAWRCHGGAFASQGLERLLLEAGEEVASASAAQPPRTPEADVLHVLTDGGRVGGHVNLVRRWIGLDGGRRHSVAVAGDLAGPLAGAAEASGGTVTSLAAARPLERAGAVRALGARHQHVVLHLDPHDPMGILAFGHRDDTPAVLFMNHADHIFWLGRACSDAFLQFRAAGAEHAVERRGIPSDRSIDLPIPLLEDEAPETRSAARAAQGIGPEETLLVTAASPYKYESRGPGLPEFVAAVLSGRGDVRLAALGPVARGPWARAAALTGGRCAALGFRRDLPTWLAATDVYLDSFPCSSLTTMLEAAQRGIPILRYRTAETPDLFHSAGPSVDAGSMTATDACTYRETLLRLIEDTELRRDLGERGRQAVTGAHTGGGWRGHLDAVYAAPRRDSPVAPAPGPRTELIDTALAELHSRAGVDDLVLEGLLHRRGPGAGRMACALWRDWPPFAAGRTGTRARELAQRAGSHGAGAKASPSG